VRFTAAGALLIVAIALVACGGDDEQRGATVVPAAGQYAQTDDSTPGVPPGASYDLTAAEWSKLSEAKQLAAVSDYVDDNPDACEDADPSRVRDYAEVSAGNDYPLTSPVAELLAEGCAAVLQSGSGDGEGKDAAGG
jgi:hypothetical protein